MSSPMASQLFKDFIHSLLSHIYGIRTFLSREVTLKTRNETPGYPCPQTAAFRLLDSEYRETLDENARYWWATSGHALAILLDKAGYSRQSQYHHLKFVLEITPSLGPSPISTQQQWKSFMTDDHNPIELSWDWRTGDKPPKIRFSIEPIGLDAGTSLDPYNQFMVSKFPETLVRLLPQTNIEWLSYFQQQLNGEEAKGSVEGHSTTVFYAFDLDHGAIVSKAYFFPGFKAKANKRTNFQVIQETIQGAPGNTPDNLRALVKFQRYVDDPTSPPLEMDMLAIDLVDPSESRFKIYFRTRDTSFASIRHTMTLGDRVQQPGIEQGLEDLRRLYYALFGSEEAEDAAEDEELPTNDHRTAGILYNVEFKYGSSSPKVKAYLPVRHYARNEAAVISALSTHSCRTGPFAKNNMSNYKDAMESIFSREALMDQSGLHTYIGCSAETDARLRLVSYINPRQLVR